MALWSKSSGEDVINIGKGHPNPAYLPAAEVTAAFEKALSPEGNGAALLQYGRMQGNEDFCIAICDWLRTKANRKKISPEEILITTGSGHGLALCCQLYSRPGDTIFVDSPAYFLSFYTFRDCGLKVVEISTDKDGMDVDEVERRLRAGERPALLYTVPICNNPCGTTLTDERRAKLVELSREFNFKILADEVYQFLQWDDVPQGCFELDDPSNPTVFALQSFSKLLGPGIRVGWIETDKKHIARLLDSGALQSGGGANPLASGMVLQLMKSGFLLRQIDLLREKYRVCCDTMCDALDAHLGDSVVYHRPLGGFFCFVTLRKEIDTQKLLDVAEKDYGVRFFAGRHFCDGTGKFNDALRLCFAYLEPKAIEAGVARLAKAIKEFS